MNEASCRSLATDALAHDSTLHVVTLHPPAWVNDLRDQLGDRCIVHQARATDAVGIIPLPDFVFIDDDKNWFTVQELLETLHARAERLQKVFPPTLLADAGWPYARRDSYADPGAIPKAFRGAHERAGLVPGRQAPGANGLFGDRFNGVVENAPRHGVLTAIEDFLAGRADQLRLTLLPGFGGLAALCSRSGAGAEAFAPAELVADMTAMAEALESARLEQAVRLADASAKLLLAEALVTKLTTLAVKAQSPVAATTSLEVPISSPASTGLPAGALSLSARSISLRAKGRLISLIRLAQETRPGRSNQVKDNLDQRGQRENESEKEALARLRASSLFDPAWYLATYADVSAAGADPALHYLRCGAAELRDPGPFFSTSYYLAAYPDVAEEKLNPLLHYLAHGAKEGRNPDIHFATRLYAEEHPEVGESGLNPLEHYLLVGRAMGWKAPAVTP